MNTYKLISESGTVEFIQAENWYEANKIAIKRFPLERKFKLEKVK